jgi:putative transposase
LYRAVDKFGDTIDFMLSEHRDEAAATVFFKQAIGANYAGLENMNRLLMLAGLISFVEILQVNYLNNLIEQDQRFIKKSTNPMMGFKAFHSAKATIDGIETAYMLRKGQLSDENTPAYKQFMALAG